MLMFSYTQNNGHHSISPPVRTVKNSKPVKDSDRLENIYLTARTGDCGGSRWSNHSDMGCWNGNWEGRDYRGG